MRGGVRKYILGKLAQRMGISARVLDRPKQGFAMPLSHWWRGELKQDLLGILLEPKTIQRGYFDPQAVRRLVDEHLNGRRNRPTDIWLLLVFELWHRNFLHSSGSMGSARVSAEASLAGLPAQTGVSGRSNDASARAD
jgi:asparagine synthase (glutamine-hydrolysing)